MQFSERTSHIAIFVLAICGWLVPATVSAQSSPRSAIDFTAHIKPILQSKCVACHGPTMGSAGVRFDQRTGVASPGYSGKPLIGGTLQTNEIYRRVSSTDPSYRMPKGQPPLSSAEVELFRRWVEAGTPWPADPLSADQLAIRRQWFSREAWLDYAERWLNEVPGFITWLCVMLVLQFGLLFVERYKQAAQRGSAWTTSSRSRWLTPLRQIGVTHYLLVTSLMTLVLSWQIITGMQRQRELLKKELSESRDALPAGVQQNTFSIYGNPPIPIHSNHPPRLSGVYYRGNCERSPQLFNGGNYRTATLHVSLVDHEGHTLEHGDVVPANGLSIRFELERAKGTTETLFGDGISKGVILTKQVLSDKLVPITEPIERMKVVEPGWKWGATVPLKGPRDQDVTVMSGLIYVYHGGVDGDQARGTVHYGIKYDLQFKDLRLLPTSDVWLGSLFWTSALENPHAGKVPLKEWFDEQPIPEITGPNSTDPKLLGIPEHLDKPLPGSPQQRPAK